MVLEVKARYHICESAVSLGYRKSGSGRWWAGDHAVTSQDVSPPIDGGQALGMASKAHDRGYDHD